MNYIVSILALVTLCLGLQGCIFVAGAAAGAAGIAVVYDHRKIEKIALDQTITNSVVNDIKRDPELGGENTHIVVTTFNQVVLLTGQTVTPELSKKAEGIARNTCDVLKVYNQITLKGPTSSLTRASDSWITTKIKTEMLATKGLQSGTIKVLTENGTVYLMGIVTHDQADITVEIARQVSGVQRVIRIFQYK